eukprot:CAMPEP_0171911564 /NCGR_PEP_ID=MMETSP0993-20121228/10376_1 /TAXON_ID=483369 /ORGANISM="non described non described, Strain CCMP2098" /LENGTH=486 /DNA_ID=CAMNT_0012545105 /DNA_START=85 /DNA_END=1545 /DNA_ORIENTATION=+
MSWFGFGKSPDTSSDKLLVQKKLWSIYQKHVAPLEQKYSFGKFYTPELREADFLSPPMVMLLGQYSTGKTTMIEYLTGAKLPGAHIGPEPTTDRFVALMYGKEARTVPGHAACTEEDLPFKSLQTYGSSFLSKFEVTQVDSEMLKDVTFVDTPGVLSGEKQRTSRGYDFTAVTKHLAERADCILLLFDCSKLDISDELKGVIQSLEGNHDKVRCLLNKADQVDSQELFRVYGALLWSLGKVVDTPEVLRVFVASMRAGPYKSSEGNDRGNQQQQQQQQQKLQLLDRNSNFNSSNQSSGSVASMISMGAPEEESEDSSRASQRERLTAPPSVVDLEASSPSPPNHRLFDLEREALLADLRALPRNAKVRRLDQVAKRFRAVKTHAMLCSHLRGEFGWVPLGQDSKQGELLRGLEGLQLGLARKHGLNAADFSDANHFKRVVRDLGIKIWKWPTTMDEELEAIDKAFAEDLKPLLAMLNDDPSGDITP